MHSSFLTWVNAGLALYSTVLFLKLLVQFGLPNHPSRFTAYVISLCATSFLVLEILTSLGFLGPVLWIKWRALPIVCGSLGLLFQCITTSGSFSLIQQKVISRIPLMAGLMCFAFFPSQADLFMTISIVAGSIFLSVSVGKARYQKRLYLKMAFFLLLSSLTRLSGDYWIFCLGQTFLYFAVFYFFVFEHTFCISSLVEEEDHFEKGLSS